ncbi:MAG: hypothetical protein ACPLSY_04715 [Moorellaceae bacterium]
MMRRCLKCVKGSYAVEPLFFILLIGLLGIGITAAFQYFSTTKERHAARTASAFFHALAAKDFAAAAALCEGAARDAVLRGEALKEKIPAGEITAEEYDATASGSLALVRAAVETATPDGGCDVGWFELELERMDKEWKVFSITQGRPPIPREDSIGMKLFLSRRKGAIPEEACDAFSAYLNDLAAGRYREAARHLAGPALHAHTATGPVLGIAPLFKEVSAIEWMRMAGDERTLVARASYTVDGREAAVVVTFYRTKNGWKVVEIEKA